LTESVNKGQLFSPKILIYGFGNPGRQDDGLGNAFIEAMNHWIREKKIPGVELESNYQLNIEDAYAISDKDMVIFVDASTEEDVRDFIVTPVPATTATVGFTTHTVSPALVVELCSELFKTKPASYLLHIKGYQWGYGEAITSGAKRNLHSALLFLQHHLKDPGEMAKLAV